MAGAPITDTTSRPTTTTTADADKTSTTTHAAAVETTTTADKETSTTAKTSAAAATTTAKTSTTTTAAASSTTAKSSTTTTAASSSTVKPTTTTTTSAKPTTTTTTTAKSSTTAVSSTTAKTSTTTTASSRSTTTSSKSSTAVVVSTVHTTTTSTSSTPTTTSHTSTSSSSTSTSTNTAALAGDSSNSSSSSSSSLSGGAIAGIVIALLVAIGLAGVLATRQIRKKRRTERNRRSGVNSVWASGGGAGADDWEGYEPDPFASAGIASSEGGGAGLGRSGTMMSAGMAGMGSGMGREKRGMSGGAAGAEWGDVEMTASREKLGEIAEGLEQDEGQYPSPYQPIPSPLSSQPLYNQAPRTSLTPIPAPALYQSLSDPYSRSNSPSPYNVPGVAGYSADPYAQHQHQQQMNLVPGQRMSWNANGGMQSPPALIGSEGDYLALNPGTAPNNNNANLSSPNNNGFPVPMIQPLAPVAQNLTHPQGAQSPTGQIASPVSPVGGGVAVGGHGQGQGLSDGMMVVVRQSFVRSMDDELVIKPGDELFLVQAYDDGWCLCEDASRARGVVPLNCLEAKNANANNVGGGLGSAMPSSQVMSPGTGNGEMQMQQMQGGQGQVEALAVPGQGGADLDRRMSQRSERRSSLFVDAQTAGMYMNHQAAMGL